jgi:multidrug efflux pump subunit AcrA (membrane-fusion protein)
MIVTWLHELIFGEIPEEEQPGDIADAESEAEDVQEEELEAEQDTEQEDNELDTVDPKALLAEIESLKKQRKSLREENKKGRIKFQSRIKESEDRLKALEEKEKQAERAKMDEVARLQAEKDDLEKARREAEQMAEEAGAIVKRTIIESAITEEATKLGFRNPELAKKLLGDISFELQDGGVTDRQDIAEALNELLESDPYLKKEGITPPKPKPKVINQPSQTDIKNPARSDIDEEIEEYNKQIRDNLKNNPTVAAGAWYKKFVRIQETSNKPVAVK